VEVVGIWQPRQWLRTRIRSFFIRTFLDHDFSLKDFTRGSKQAFALVSNQLSQCKLDLLEELVAKEVFQVWKERLALLSDDNKNALTVDMDKIMLAAAEDIHIYFDDSGRRFARILMGFWYRTSAVISEGAPVGAKVFSFGPEKAKPVVTAKYEFQREFTQGVKPDWTITWIEYPQLL
ncbi:m-AAA protease-interacting protein 1, mitochondrial, partial [Alligator sinensis]|uniref:M-AAA protease-interacting protein 1, mitochondrial n=1 Tax=Alligator sinensis TaxID=38654 RepID=A0A1U7RV75_ALLSI